ncbi:uncharacterized protein LOC115628984 [Scaptodrosophila lebanonensis]|uniref:Uncharacterized protein LOC115628984 n=1 Tax=Drosophila lebanonensis TaxID=7225 RepID=A0A6J2U0X9_DROLE|nr:uncharacterized protein LOC115628984 [Scaptodrosophila lebanonensis]
MSLPLLDEEELEALVYERSKIWSSLLKCFEEQDDEEIIEMHNIEKLFESDVEDNDESVAGTDEAEEDDVEDDIANTTVTKTRTELALMLYSGENKQETQELQVILNQTLPVFEEHKRKWRDAGLDRILDTFDEQKIEVHVGDWLRRNNSVYGGKLTPEKSATKRSTSSDETDSGSISSAEYETVDTARYVRKRISKPRLPIPMKIDRTHMRKRQELRAEFSATDYDEVRRYRKHERDTPLRIPKPTYRQSQQHRSRCSHQHYKHYSRKPRASALCSDSSSSDMEVDYCGPHCECTASKRHDRVKTMYHCCTYHSHHRSSGCGRSMRLIERNVRHLRRQHALDEDLHMDMRPRVRESDCSCCNRKKLCSNVVHVANSSTEEWIVENGSSSSSPYVEANLMRVQTLSMKTASAELTSAKAREALSQAERKLLPTPKAHRKVLGVFSKTDPAILPFISEEPVNTKKTKRATVEAEKKKAKPTNTNESIVAHEGQEIVNATPKSLQKRKPGWQLKCVKEPEKDTPLKSISYVEKENSSNIAKAGANEERIVKAKTTSLAVNRKTSQALTELPRNRDQEPLSPPKVTETPTKTNIQNRKSGKKTNSNMKSTADKKLKPIKTAPLKRNVNNSAKKKNLTTSIDDSTESDEVVVVSDDNDSSWLPSRQRTKKTPQAVLVEEDIKLALLLSKETYMSECTKRQQKEETASSPQLPEPTTFNNQSVACNSTALVNNTACDRALGSKRNMKRSTDVSSTLKKSSPPSTASSKKQKQVTEEADCTVVTSTTCCESSGVVQPTAKHSLQLTANGILLYAPPERGPASSSSKFELTEQSLGGIIGERTARKFLKYHVGSRSFDSRLSVYYRPSPKLRAALTAGVDSLDLCSSSSSDSDDDIFEYAQRYGNIHTVLEQASK